MTKGFRLLEAEWKTLTSGYDLFAVKQVAARIRFET